MLRQQLMVDPRLVINALQMGRGHQPDQIPVALQISGQQQKVIVRILASGRGFLFEPVSRGHVNLTTHDRLHPRFRGCLIKLDGPVQVAVIRQGEGRLVELFGPVHQLRNPAGPVQQGVLRMAVEMDKGFGHRKSNLISCNGFTSQNPVFPSFFGKNF